MSDAEIVGQVLAGNTGAFAAIVERYGDMALHLLARIVGDGEQARDVVQEVFVKVWGSLSRWRGDSVLGTWIYRIAYNAAITAARRAQPVVPLTERFEGRFDVVADDDTSELERRDAALRRALAQLAPDDRALLTLYYDDDLPMADIAAITGLSLSNVKVRLHRVRSRLKKMML